MIGSAIRARRALVDIVCRIVAGRGVAGDERVTRDVELSGFRKAARAALLRRLAPAGFDHGGMTVLAPALDGLFRIAVAADDFGVGWEILERGTYEPHVVAFYRRTLRPGGRVVDIGANVGFHALHAASLVGPGGKVMAVEPDPNNVALLRTSLSLQQGPSPVEVVEAALSDRDGELVLSDLGNAGNSGARFTHADRRVLERHVHGPSPTFRTVRALRWDAHFMDTRLDVVKIDVEGFEPRVLRGMEGSLERHRPIVLSEFAPSNLRSFGGIEPGRYLAWFRERRYACAVLDETTGEAVPVPDAAVLARAGERHHVDLVFTPE